MKCTQYTHNTLFLLLVVVCGSLGSCSLFSSGEEEIVVGGLSESLNFTNLQPDWSSDGQWIIYFFEQLTPADSIIFGVYKIRPDGSDQTLVYDGIAGFDPVWSPDGKWFAFSQAGQIYKREVEGDSLVQLTRQGNNFHPKWSPDGTYISFTRNPCTEELKCGTWIVSNDTGEERLVVEFGSSAEWIDNRMLSYLRNNSGSDGQSLLTDLWETDLDSNKPRMLGTIDRRIQRLDYSQANDLLLTVERAPVAIWTMDVNGRLLDRLAGRNERIDEDGISWSPDGEHIVYVTVVDEEGYKNRYLWIMDKDGKNKRQLTFKPE